MKEIYNVPECELINIGEEDVITASYPVNVGGTDVELDNLPIK